MPRSRQTRERIAALAETGDYNPHEADNARRMLEAMPETRLEVIASDIREEYGKGIDAQFAIGRLLMEARAIHADDQGFGAWLKEQDFPFSQQTAWRLRSGYEREGEVRAFIASHAGPSDRGIGVAWAVELLAKKAKVIEQIESGTLPETQTSAFAVFERAAEALIEAMTQLPNDELAKLAAIIRGLADHYQRTRALR